MRVAIDGEGRLVVPKPLREELGIEGPAELEMDVRLWRLEATVATPEDDGGAAPPPARVERRDGHHVIVTDVPMPTVTAEETREMIELARERRW